MLAKSSWWPAVFGLVLALGVLGLAAPPARMATRLGVAVHITGEAWVKHSAARDWQKLLTGAGILAGDQVQVNTGEVEILMSRGDHIHLAAGSKMTFSKSSLLHLILGEAWFRIQSRLNGEGFSVKTPAGVVGVRGTVFSVSVDPSGETMVRVVSGKVSVENHRGRVLAQPGDSAFLHSESEKKSPTLESHGDNAWPELKAWSDEREHEESGETAPHDSQTQGHESETHNTGADHGDSEAGHTNTDD